MSGNFLDTKLYKDKLHCNTKRSIRKNSEYYFPNNTKQTNVMLMKCSLAFQSLVLVIGRGGGGKGEQNLKIALSL